MESDAMTWNEVAASIIDDDRGKWDRKLPAASLSVGQNGQLVTMNGGPAAEPYVLSELATGHQPAPLPRRLRPARALPQRPGCRRARAEPGDDAGQRFARRAGRGGVDAGGQAALGSDRRTVGPAQPLEFGSLRPRFGAGSRGWARRPISTAK